MAFDVPPRSAVALPSKQRSSAAVKNAADVCLTQFRLHLTSAYSVKAAADLCLTH